MDSRVFFAALALAGRVSRLNPAAGEIGAGMLASLVADARAIQSYLNPKDATEQIAATEEAGAVYDDGVLLREMVGAILNDTDRADTAQQALAAMLETAPPGTVSEYLAHLRAAFQQSKGASTS